MQHETQIALPVLKVLDRSLLGELSTTEVRLQVKAAIDLDAEDLEPIRNRSDVRIDQIIRNLKSHKDQRGNPFFEGLIEDVPRGFKITEKGRKQIKRR